MRPVDEIEILHARTHLTSLCDQFEAFLTLNAGNATDEDIQNFQDDITLAARTFTSLLRGVRPEDMTEVPRERKRHLHAVT